MRTHYCGQINEQLLGQDVTVAGWVHRRRDHGGVIFVDLPARGLVQARPAGTVNANLASGRVEIVATELELLNRCEPLPFQLDETVNEEVRLRYRYIDLRREVMSRRLRQRHRITRSMRGFLDAQGFVDIETTMLTTATTEGARDD